MSARYEEGLNHLSALNGGDGAAVVSGLRSFAPAAADSVVEFIFGDLYANQDLDLRSRQIATIAAIATLGHAQPQLEIHLRGALNIGLSQAEITEILRHIAAYAGFPAALNALSTARRVFEDVTPSPDRSNGHA